MLAEHGYGATTGRTPEQHFAFARGRQEDVVILSTEDLKKFVNQSPLNLNLALWRWMPSAAELHSGGYPRQPP